MKIIFPCSVTLVNNLKAALLAASTDAARIHMHGVLVEWRPKIVRFVATNGQWLWINETEADSDGEGSILIRRDNVKEIVKGIKGAKKYIGVPVELDADGKTFRQMTNVLGFDSVNAMFPPYAEIIPGFPRLLAEGKKQQPIALAWDLLAAVCYAFARIEPKAAVTISCGGPLDPVVCTSESAPYAMAAVMPRRDNKDRAEQLSARYRKRA